MINIDVLSYFLNKNSYRFHVFNYDKTILTTTMRHFDASEERSHTLVVAQESDYADLSLVLTDFGAGNILVYITRNLSSSVSFSQATVPVIAVESREHLKLYNLLGYLNEQFNGWERNLQFFNLTGKNYQELIDYTDSLLDFPFSLVDNNFVYIAYSKEKSAEMGYIEELVENGRLSTKIAAQLMSTPGFEELEHHREVFDFEDAYHFLAKNIHVDGQFVARLVLMYSSDPYENAYHSYLLNQLAACITSKYQREGTFYVNQEPTHLLRLFIKNSLSGETVTEALWSQGLQEKNWTFSDRYALMVFEATYRREKKLHAEYLCPQIENMWHYVAATEWNDKTVVLINQKHMDKNFEQSLAYFVRDNLLTAGISQVFTDFSCLSCHLIQATIAMETGIEKDPHLWYYFFDHYAVSYIKKQCTGQLPAAFVCHPALLTLQEYDQKNDSQYAESLRLFIQTQYNMSAAADLAYVHRTTFIKRMERIVELTGIDLTDWNTRMHLMLSYSLI